MGEKEMDEIAEFIKRVVVYNQNVKEDVIDFRRDFTKLRYCFTDDQKAYDYFEFGDRQ